LQDKKYTTISIPTPLAEKVKKQIEGTGFNSLSSYTTYVLRQIVSSKEPEDRVKGFTKEDEEKIKERLRNLGYID
jgi:CRISPR/Cas system type I-B associated protein Csh2 (Cas7 group RAMP superfamily)